MVGFVFFLFFFSISPLSKHAHTCVLQIRTYIHACICIHTYIHAYIHTCKHVLTCLRTYIHSYIHTYIHTSSHTYTCMSACTLLARASYVWWCTVWIGARLAFGHGFLSDPRALVSDVRQVSGAGPQEPAALPPLPEVT